jgi:Protein of unknown function (DUF2585)
LKSAKKEPGNKSGILVKPDIPIRTSVAGLVLIILATAFVEFSMGRHTWGIGGIAGFWSGDIWSEHNSQFFLDPYTFTHISHGILFYALLSLAFRAWPVTMRLMLAAGLEGAWEVLENSDFIINRYRAETISLNYFGDSVVNSVGDILACMTGFWLASKLPKTATIALVIGLEIGLLVWTRDNLTLNIVMLIHPSSAIRAWQLGH